MKYLSALLLLFYLTENLQSQQADTTKFGCIYRFESNNTSFPHENRKEGHVYKEQHYSIQEHYRDSSVIMFIPSYYTPKDSIDLVFYFHGWNNNIDTTIYKFNLLEQFYSSSKNGILVLAETAVNSPDSYGGKLQEKDIFKNLVTDVFQKIEDVYGLQNMIGNITLAGHSGAWKVMSYILMNGGLSDRISAVYLFDALYGDVEKYIHWLDYYNGKFINIYTPNGGTKSESENLMLCFRSWKIPYKLIEDDDFSSDDLKESRIIFIKSDLGHSYVISTKNQFQKFLESSF